MPYRCRFITMTVPIVAIINISVATSKYAEQLAHEYNCISRGVSTTHPSPRPLHMPLGSSKCYDSLGPHVYQAASPPTFQQHHGCGHFQAEKGRDAFIQACTREIWLTCTALDVTLAVATCLALLSRTLPMHLVAGIWASVLVQGGCLTHITQHDMH